MKALTWQGKRQLSVEEVPDPQIQEPTDAIIRVTSTAICGSDLHLYEVMGPYLNRGDILGHEPMGIVEEVGSAVTNIKPGDKVVVPFNIACGDCFMCNLGLQSQCETTQVREKGSGAALFGYTELYGSVPGGQAEYLRVPFANYGPVKATNPDIPDERYLFLSDILPTAWQAVDYASVPDGGTLAVFGLGPVGQLASRIGRHLGHRVIGIERVPERRAMAERHGIATLDWNRNCAEDLREMTSGRGPDAVVDAVGMESHGSPVAAAAQAAVGVLPHPVAKLAMSHAGVDRLATLHTAIDAVRRGGTVSLSGVYGGEADPMPMMKMFDKQVQLRMGQCNVRRWIPDLLPLVEDDGDPLALSDLVTHRVPLDRAPEMYGIFQKKEEGCIKVVLHP
ncbi:theronine dehydrogenase-like Zn-dependent dehydrogenase [Arthrobacter crystallopoietes BAB-32]|uniref:Theronine dehydrogenase-like Zn-dependent dehydrogenase n=1 Tax=Arthrobacter crystallopoietes BAB-32 TaxID=1246476 RepID=N1V490_9MICC|nr:zinc-dependent alcohol dehydrogenase [Arthrobacter crystallopoietes]EMY33073.1 theronine dehydrogenase-like Zn-dependent dehydrogenase [Arthrobacter crystallopoietes BAB-32]